MRDAVYSSITGDFFPEEHDQYRAKQPMTGGG
jgi:hypothetical protein